MENEEKPENPKQNVLEHDHSPEAIDKRLNLNHQHGGMGDFVLGSVDGAVTTFAIVSGVAGANLSLNVAIVLGLANVAADGFSMAASNYLKAKSDRQNLERYRQIERKHIQQVPEGEREEVRQIYASKGFTGEALENAVNTITADQNRWVDTMLKEEWGLSLHPPSPVRSGTITFVAFLLAGMIPLAPLFLTQILEGDFILLISAVATGITFLIIGALRGGLANQSKLAGAVETLLVGGTAAGLAYVVGALLRRMVEETV